MAPGISDIFPERIYSRMINKINNNKILVELFDILLTRWT